MAAAAVPLLGEPQMNKQTKEAKATRQETKASREETKASRLEKRDKIREEESVSSSCPTGSTSFTHDDEERSPLVMELPRTANLFGQPGSRHRIPVTLTNRGSASSHLMLSHQEAFPVHSLDSFATHVELVAGIQPPEVEQISDKLYHGTSTEEELSPAVVKIWICSTSGDAGATNCAVQMLHSSCCNTIVAVLLLQLNCCSEIVAVS